MERSHGGSGVSLVECINPRLQKYRVRWDVKDETDPETGSVTGVSFLEEEFLHKPSLKEVKETVIAGYNAAIDERIKSGYYWEGVPVWLSTENQFNYKAAYDLAVQTEGASLPVTFKFGTDGTPVYHTFETLDDLKAFYEGALGYVSETLAEGWAEKDAIDWSGYEELLEGEA